MGRPVCNIEGCDNLTQPRADRPGKYETRCNSCVSYWRYYRLRTPQVKAMIEEQGGKCAICEKGMDKPCVDHCHTTMKVRQILCDNCNMGLGQFKDDEDILAKAIEYLRRNKDGRHDATCRRV